MSVLGKQINVLQNRIVAVPPLVPCLSIREDEGPTTHYRGYKYRIGATFQIEVTLNEDIPLEYAIKDTRAKIIHEVFGEFIEPLTRALYIMHGNPAEANKLIRDVLTSMKEI